MWPIIYKILYPGILGFLVLGGIAIHDFTSYKKNKPRKKGNKSYSRAIIFSIAGLFSLALGVHYSFDLILQDFIMQSGVYVRCNRNNDVQKLYFDVDGKIESYDCLLSTKNEIELEKGEIYEYTYGKRTEILIDIKEIS